MEINNVEEYIKDISGKVSTLDVFFNNVIDEYSSNLDNLMKGIKQDILDVGNVPINVLENYFIKLSTEVYFMSSTVEKLGLFDSLSKAKAQETYDTKYLEYQQEKVDGKKPTVAEISAKANLESMYDETLAGIYAKAYKTIKNKISAAETMISTLSKILSHRMQESQLTTQQTERQILNEEHITTQQFGGRIPKVPNESNIF